MPCQEYRDGNAGEIIIAERRMTRMAGNQYLVLTFALDVALAVGE
jgi:hypothetical protein